MSISTNVVVVFTCQGKDVGGRGSGGGGGGVDKASASGRLLDLTQQAALISSTRWVDD